MTAELNIERVAHAEKAACPSCRQVPDTWTFGNGDTVSGLDGEPRRSAVLLWGDCPLCCAEVFEVGLTVVSAAAPETYFFDDACWEGGKPELYAASIGDLRWTFEHFRNVRGATFHAGAEGGTSRTADCAWLDRHSIGPLPKSDEVWDQARDIIRTLTPALLAVKW